MIARKARWPKSARPETVAAVTALADRALILPPGKAGEFIARVERRAKRVLVGRDAKVIAIVERLAPVNHFGTLKRMTAGP